MCRGRYPTQLKFFWGDIAAVVLFVIGRLRKMMKPLADKLMVVVVGRVEREERKDVTTTFATVSYCGTWMEKERQNRML